MMDRETALASTRDRLVADVDEQLFTLGVQARISVSGEPVLDLALGEDGLGRPVAPDTVFRVYCTIKPVAAMAVGLLVEQGSLTLDEPLEATLPEYRALHGGVTLRQVMTHTAGLHRPDGVAVELTPPSGRRALLEGQRRPDGWSVGTDAAYSEYFGWHLVGELLSRTTGQSVRDHLRDAVLDPLGLTDTHIGMDGDEYRAVLGRLGVNVDLRALNGFPMLFERTERVCVEPNCAHGGYTTAADLDAFYRALLRVWSGERVAGLPGPDVVHQFCSDVRPSVYDLVMQRECAYGLGFMTSLSGHQFGAQCSDDAFGHSGNVGSSFAFADPVHDLAVSIVFNGVVDHESAFVRRMALVRSIYQDLGLDGPPSEIGADGVVADDPASGPGPRKWFGRDRRRRM